MNKFSNRISGKQADRRHYEELISHVKKQSSLQKYTFEVAQVLSLVHKNAILEKPITISGCAIGGWSLFLSFSGLALQPQGWIKQCLRRRRETKGGGFNKSLSPRHYLMVPGKFWGQVLGRVWDGLTWVGSVPLGFGFVALAISKMVWWSQSNDLSTQGHFFPVKKYYLCQTKKKKQFLK